MSKKRVGLSDVIEVIPKVLQTFLNFCLVLLALILSFLLIKELTVFVKMLLMEGSSDYKQFLANILIFFLYFEFITMIVKYFKEDYHFPLRYFLYVGITAMIRLIIVEHDHPIDTLLYSLVILILIIGYFIMNVTPLERPNRHWFLKKTEEIKRGTLHS
ncbi:phosphate-starvation-inducible protein PsiE [Psychrobacillus sp. FJAT-51614]|uniref:Protein PsiE n=1 Tax=Psychrobacillus mangrovi TaxID=3117745 RepID=A0ABU8FA15_9BACI